MPSQNYSAKEASVTQCTIYAKKGDNEKNAGELEINLIRRSHLGGTRTLDLEFRRFLLYPAELPGDEAGKGEQ
jgi:hypothetical protein